MLTCLPACLPATRTLTFGMTDEVNLSTDSKQTGQPHQHATEVLPAGLCSTFLVRSARKMEKPVPCCPMPNSNWSFSIPTCTGLMDVRARGIIPQSKIFCSSRDMGGAKFQRSS